MTMNWQDEIITLFLFIHKHFKTSLGWHCARMATYSDLSFTDEEVMTIFIFGIMNKQRTIKEIYILKPFEVPGLLLRFLPTTCRLRRSRLP